MPAVVASAGFGGVKEMLLPTFADALAEAGIACLIFDYAGFGESAGTVRQHIDPVAQAAQYRSALSALAADPRIDADRLGVWGPSLAGGHTLRVSATNPLVRCAVAIIPFIAVPADGASPALMEAVVADAEARERGEAGGMVASTGQPGDLAVMTSDGAAAWAEAVSADAPNFRNEVTLASLLELIAYQSIGPDSRLDLPLRVILAASDTITPAESVRVALDGVASNVDWVEFPETHFELFDRHLDDTVTSTVEWFATHL